MKHHSDHSVTHSAVIIEAKILMKPREAGAVTAIRTCLEACDAANGRSAVVAALVSLQSNLDASLSSRGLDDAIPITAEAEPLILEFGATAAASASEEDRAILRGRKQALEIFSRLLDSGTSDTLVID